MGYYADYDGNITFKDKLPTELIKAGQDEFETFHYDEVRNEAEVCGHDKYYEDSVYDFLQLIEPYTKAGEIEYQGEDNCFWRFIFKGGKWDEENGSIYYETELPQIKTNEDRLEFLGEIIDIFEDFLEEKCISWENDERNGDEDAAIFYGTEYGYIQDQLELLMRGWNVM